MTEQLPSDPLAAACLGRDALEAAAVHQRADPDPDHGQFYRHGHEIVGVVTALDDLALTLAKQVARYDDQRLLRDDNETRPADRLETARGHLAELHTALSAAARHANQFWSAISHVGVEVDPHARQKD